MRSIVATCGLLCAALVPGTVLAQGSSSNVNDCSISPIGTNASGIVTVEATGVQAGQTVMLTGASVTFPTTLSNDPVIGAYIQGGFGLVPGLNVIPTEVTVRVAASNTLEIERNLHVTANVTVDIQDPNPGFVTPYLAPLDATVVLPNSVWNPTDVDVEFTQVGFVLAGGGTIIDCAPSVSPTLFESVEVTPPPCSVEDDCNGNGTCDFWGNCICDFGFGGPDCACEDAFTCNGAGACNAAGQCYCDPGFGGANCDCEDAISCSGNGQCNFESDCVCDLGYMGLDCATQICMPSPTCNDNGECVAGDCVCDEGYAGASCQIAICTLSANCNGAPVGVADAYTRVVCTDEPCAATGGLTVLDGSTMTFQDLDLPVFDHGSINLGLAVGGMTTPTIQPPDPLLSSFVAGTVPQTSPESSTFRIEYISDDALGTLYILAHGDAVCPPDEPNDPDGICRPQDGENYYDPWDATYVTTDANILGTLVGSGPGQLPTVLDGAPVTYALDGDTVCRTTVGATECVGTAYLNAFLGFSTDVGTNQEVAVNQVYVDPSDPSGETVIPVNIDIKYAQIDEPVPPEPVFTTVVTTSEAAGTISSNYKINGLGFTPVFFEITTNGVVGDNSVTICVEYQEPTVEECNLRLLHNPDSDNDNVFFDITKELSEEDVDCPFFETLDETCDTNSWCINPTTNQVCGRTLNGLSPITIAVVDNQAPIAAAGPDQAITLIDTLVQLDGSDSYDLDGDAFTYAWTLSTPSGSEVELVDPSSATPSFTPDLYGDYLATLVVTDSEGSPSTPDDVLVSFDNVSPVADAGENLAARVGDSVLLDGSGSDDANGDPLTYEWGLFGPSGSVATLNDPTSEMPTFTPDVSGTYEVQLIVSDGFLSDITSVDIVATTAEGDLADTLEYAMDVVNDDLDPAVFKNKSLQKNMAKHIGQALAQVDQGKFGAARNKLEAVLRTTDGCANGASPDPNDWIEDCAGQSQVHPLIVQAIALIDEILGQ